MKVNYIFVSLLVLSLFAFLTVNVKADETSNPSSIQVATMTPKPGGGIFGFTKRFEEKNETPNPSRSPKAWGKDRLKDKRLKTCQIHEDEIKKRHKRLEDISSKMFNVFDETAKRVEDYYKNKVVPSGKSLPNYDALVNDVVAKKAAVRTALTNTQNDIAGFTCTADNPKAQITQYRLDMQTVKKALQDYRTSIKNLIVAVRTLVGGTPAPSGTPKVTATPTATP